jgi:hypothetical protein
MSDISITDKNLLYIRYVDLTIFPPIGSPISMKDLRIKFNIEKTNESNPNTSKIEVYNLSETSRSAFEDKKTRVVLEAGYLNTKAVIFQGNVTKAVHKYQRVNIITTVELGDGDNRYRNARLDKGYPPGISTQQVINDLAAELQLPVSNIKGIPVFKYANGLTLSGVARDHLDIICEKDDLEWSIQDETLQIIPKRESTDDSIILLDSSSGLIGSPEKTDKGVQFETLLMPRLRPGRRAKLDSKFIKGNFKIRKVAHDGDSLSGTFLSKSEATK